MRRYLTLEQVKDFLKTGDILLSHGIGGVSVAVEEASETEWSHSAIIISPEDIDFPGKDLLIWESSILTNLTDLSNPGLPPAIGPMLVKLEDRIRTNLENNTDDYYAVRRIANLTLDDDQKKKLKQVIKDAKDATFPAANAAMVKDFVLGRFLNQPPAVDGRYFCSGLVAHTLMTIGVISQDYVFNSYFPQDFTSEYSGSLPLLNGAYLLPEIYFRYKNTPADLEKPIELFVKAMAKMSPEDKASLAKIIDAFKQGE